MNEITKELLDALKACLKNCARWHPADPTVLGAISAIAKAEAALAEPQADADGWIPWSGGECPVETPAHNLFIRFRNGKEASDHASRAQSYVWQYEGKAHPADIIAYRIAKGADK